jgi:hypothetical protein
LNDVRFNLSEFLKHNINHDEIKLISIYRNSDADINIYKLKQKIVDNERKTTEYIKKLNKLQADYHVLIGITAELVDSLEKTISGMPVTSEYISNICLKLFNSQTKQSLNTVRPGTAGELVRSLALPKLRQDQNFYKYKKTKTLKQTNKQTVINNNFLK